ncbi:MAG: aldehyde dehydrogenase family protein [Bacteroidetes bacterium]|nr:aldehyde dehydrogenase family protein [Bacteroidota bacterium]
MNRHPLIGDSEIIGNAGERAVINPYDSSTIGSVTYADSAQMSAAIGVAADAPKQYSLTAQQRADILTKAARLLQERKEEFARLITLEAGKPITYSRVEVDRAVFTMSASATAASTWDDDRPVDTMGAPNAAGRSVTMRYFPAGPVAAITPFNFPLNLVMHKVAPAIACGCSVVLKPAPQTPLTAFLLADTLTEAGLPPGWLNIVPCENDVAEELVTDDRIKVVSFTGSAAVGWKLKSLAPKKKVTLELGGNGAVIVDEVTDWEKLIPTLASSAFYYAGQVCISLQRLFVRRELYGELVKRIVRYAGTVTVGDPIDAATVVGPLISEAAASKAWTWVERAVAAGAKKHTGERLSPRMISPTVLTDVPTDCEISCEEAFAPVVIVEPYDDFDAMLSRVNSSRYGLQAGLFTTDQTKTRHAYETLELGGLIINDTNTFRIDTMPYGGVKDSGFGREGVTWAMQEMCEVKVLVKP